MERTPTHPKRGAEAHGRRWAVRALACGAMLTLAGSGADAGTDPEAEVVNSVGMRLRRVEAGTFLMGVGDGLLPPELREPADHQEARAGTPHRRYGDFDEWPRHQVTISRPFHMGVHEVTNAQYEMFDPAHRERRGELGFSTADNEAVVFVSWNDAVEFCRWLSRKEKKPYRLPTEAEWEYAARAGTKTPFHTGETLPAEFRKNVGQSWFPAEPTLEKAERISLTVGRTPPNAWGLYDVHGNVEEWVSDWYGPYVADAQVDPGGRAFGEFRVTRGGSHSTEPYYLRSANRSGTVPEDQSWLIGFRVVLGEQPDTTPLPPVPEARYRVGVAQQAPTDLAHGPDPDRPYFEGPRQYVKVPPLSFGPMFSYHNHDPAIVEAWNGDLLAIWYTCMTERSRELGLLASRLRHGEKEWEPASLFWDAPDRNDHTPALWFDGDRTIHFFVGLSAAATWGNLAIVHRTSTDNGVTWSRPRLIVSDHGPRRMPEETVFRTREGVIVMPADDVPADGTALWLSRDQGRTWTDPGGTIAGIHAGVAQLGDGRLMALGRGRNIDGRMPKSLSEDMGATWTYGASAFPPVGGGQRPVLLRLREGPLLFASFADEMTIRDASGRERTVHGLFAALSYDDGKTWPARRLVSDDGPGREIETLDGRLVTMGLARAEPRGYLSVCQTKDDVVQLISSRQHYAFNLKWLETPPPAAPSAE